MRATRGAAAAVSLCRKDNEDQLQTVWAIFELVPGGCHLPRVSVNRPAYHNGDMDAPVPHIILYGMEYYDVMNADFDRF